MHIRAGVRVNSGVVYSVRTM